MKQWLAIVALLPALASADEGSKLWQQIGFTATEVLIYTDQLQKLDATECNQGPVSTHNTAAKREQLLQRLEGDDRTRLATLLDSPMVQGLLDENSQGIAAMLDQQQLTGAGPSDAKRGLCLELSLSFSDNLQQAETELLELIARYRQP